MKGVAIGIAAVLLVLTAVVWARIAWEKRRIIQEFAGRSSPPAEVTLSMHGWPAVGPWLQIIVRWDMAYHEAGKAPGFADDALVTVIQDLGLGKCKTDFNIRE